MLGRSYWRFLDRTTCVRRTSQGTRPATPRGNLYARLAANGRDPGAVHDRQDAHRSDTMHQQREHRSQPLTFRTLRGQLVAVRQAMAADTLLLAELLCRLSERALHLRYMR